ncbi:MAG TPA: DUF5686 family protein [Puia sp.]|nr:DUF5686 family protein [Puia sp.]
MLIFSAAAAQERVISGTVADSLTGSPLANVTVIVKNSHRGVITNAAGVFRISVDKNAKQLIFSITGYQPRAFQLTDEQEQKMRVWLAKSYATLGEVVVKAKPGKYRNKNNPAVDLIHQVIANKSKNGPGYAPYFSYNQYEKIRVMIDKLPSLLINNRVMNKFHFIFDNQDSTVLPGKVLTPVFIEEMSSANYQQQHPVRTKKIVLAKKSVDFGEYLDMKGISLALHRMYEDFNIYENNIPVFTIQFKSPISDLGPTYYMYFIRDTIVDKGVKLVKLYFTPRNPEDLLFRGYLFITLDGNYAVRKFDLEVSKHINLNYIRNFKVTQDFEKGPGDHYHLASSDMLAFFSPFPKTPGILGERSISVTHVSDTLIPETVFHGAPVDTLPGATHQSVEFWDQERPVPLKESEIKTYANTDSLLHMRSYRRLMDYAILFTAGYKSAGKVDIGPIASFLTFNPLEGTKLRFGGRTNAKLSTRYFAESYVAYGFKDGLWKYYLSGTYSINHKSIYTFPFHFIQASYLHDTRNPGQENVFAQNNTFLGSFSRGDNTKWLYNNIFRLTYIQEFENHLSYSLGMKYWLQQPAGSLNFVYESPLADKSDTTSSLTTTELSATLRFAPHEQFYQGKSTRANITNKYPIVTFQYSKGIKGLLGGQYNYDAFHLNIYKRAYLAPFGYTDMTLDAGYLSGNLPFPLLIIHPANQSYFYFENAYNMMNYGEFVSDHYAGINVDHFFAGFFLNKIPGLKRLRLREVIAAKLLFGGVRDENNPDINANQMKFPTTNGATSTFVLGGKPYLEASFGIYNIFSIIRLDLVKRFTYLENPGIPGGWGLRVSTNFIF